MLLFTKKVKLSLESMKLLTEEYILKTGEIDITCMYFIPMHLDHCVLIIIIIIIIIKDDDGKHVLNTK